MKTILKIYFWIYLVFTLGLLIVFLLGGLGALYLSNTGQAEFDWSFYGTEVFILLISLVFAILLYRYIYKMTYFIGAKKDLLLRVLLLIAYCALLLNNFISSYPKLYPILITEIVFYIFNLIILLSINKFVNQRIIN